MYPVLFTIDLFSNSFSIHTYGVMIVLGAFAAYIYVAITAKKKLNIPSETIQALARVIIIAAVIGGKLFFYMEKPDFYFYPPSNMLVNFRTGFVFYGSLLFVIPSVIWFYKKHKLPIMPMLNLLTIGGLMLHIFGRMGCFFSGCCYGTETDGPIFIQFTNEAAIAPTNVHLHPTQLYSVFLLLSILVFLWILKKYKRFEGQLFFIYIMLYAFGRSIIEIFRGDIQRGFIIENVLSYSQLISLILIVAVGVIYIKLKESKTML